MRIPRSSGFGPVALALVGLLGSGGCGSPVEANFRLVNPCSPADKVLGPDGLGCLFLDMSIYSLDPGSPLFACEPARDANCCQVGAPGCARQGPLVKTCDMLSGACDYSADELVGVTRMVVDVTCTNQMMGQPLARATSQPMLFDTGPQGDAGLDLSLLIGAVNSFVDTAALAGATFGQCTGLAQDSGRYGHTATLLEDGRVLIAGGIRRLGSAEEILATAEIFDPRTGLHQMVLGPGGMPARMTAPSGRAYHTATKLRDGRVLLAGGVAEIGNPPKWTSLQSAEIFNPTSNVFESPMTMGGSRAHHTASLLNTGKVLLLGGLVYDGKNNVSSYLGTGVVFDPSSFQWAPVGNAMASSRARHQAVVLDTGAGGRVLVLGGENSGGALNSTDIYNPETNTFYTGTPTMSKNRSRLCAVRLKSGLVLVAGGTTTPGPDFNIDRTVEVYDPTGGTLGAFIPDVATLAAARMQHTCTALDDGHVLVVGGLSGNNTTTTVAEIIQVGAGTYTAQQVPEPLNPPRFQHTATRLANGWVLFTGGLPTAESDAAALTQSVLFVSPMPYSR
jgi:hypothetical protein